MPATRTPASSAARTSAKAPARPVREQLLEIAFRLHATKPIGRLPAARERR